MNLLQLIHLIAIDSLNPDKNNRIDRYVIENRM